MQNRYVADVGDFGKYGLLRALTRGESPGDDPLSLGVVWHLTNDETGNSDGKYTGYLNPTPKHLRDFRACDPELYEALAAIITGGQRNVAAVQESGILPRGTTYFDTPLPAELSLPGTQIVKNMSKSTHRQEWTASATHTTRDCDLVYLDPDNGIKLMQGPRHLKTDVKRVFLQEAVQYAQQYDQSLVIYHHVQRNAPAAQQAQTLHLHLYQALGRRAFTMHYHRGSARLFIIAPAHRHRDQLYRRAQEMTRGPWGRHFDLTK